MERIDRGWILCIKLSYFTYFCEAFRESNLIK